ncbi:MAG: FAD-dependent oxidoreductase [Vicinamibacteria bacterium]|nr:FAD-dependent oxidoreductase [Vicinamibacteria bacterium]
MKVAVIGAGIAGLTCAFELHKAGVDVEVFERDATVGGRMNTRTKDGLAFDVGANFLIRAYQRVNALAGEMGVTLHRASPVAHRFYRDGVFHLMNFTSIRDIFRLDGLNLVSRFRFLAFAVKVRTAHAGLDFFDLGLASDDLNREDAYSYAVREVGQEFADYILDSFNSCMMFSRSTETSVAAFLSLFGMMADPAFDFSVMHAVGDMRAIPEALAEKMVVHRGCPVLAVEPQGGSWSLATQAGSSRFDRVVMAATPLAALKMLKSGPEGPAALLAQTRYASTINASFRVPMEALGRTHCFYVPYVENRVISEFTNESLKGEHTTHEGTSLVNVGLHEEAALRLLGEDDAKVFEVVRSELLGLNASLREVADRVTPYDLQRWPEAIPKYDCGQISRVKEFLREGQGREGLYLCGDYMNAPWIEGASRSGQKTARQLLRSLA